MAQLQRRVVTPTSILRRTALLAAGLALSACVAAPAPGRQAISLTDPGSASAAAAGRKVAILLPLNGSMSGVGQAMLKGAQLSLSTPGAPQLIVQDTGGTPDGAIRAAQAALAAGAGLVLGPLTGPETAAIAPAMKAAGVPVLAFTSDQTVAQPGIWVLGLTPAQQVRRLVLAVQAENRPRVTAVLPQNPFGDALATALVDSTHAAGLPDPRITRSGTSFASINDALKEASGFATRRGAIEAEQKAARARKDPDSTRDADAIGQRPVPPPPMDALFLGLNGDQLGQAVPQLTFYDVAPANLRVLGPATWAQLAGRQPALAGAWFAAPDPAARTGFDQQYAAKYNAPATDFASLAYDAAGIARAAAGPTGFPAPALTRSEGYAGANGLLALAPDGQVRRGLAIFELDRAGAHVVQPAPGAFGPPGS